MAGRETRDGGKRRRGGGGRSRENDGMIENKGSGNKVIKEWIKYIRRWEK